ncbi:MAG: alpha/beta fold hydrolase [Bacteroidales bacterium]|nr:alpha/beta fold hydrolase [Bacteroidales bacterium]
MRKITLNDYVSSIEKAVEQIGTSPVLIGHSMGGRVIQKYMESHRVPAGVLFASAPPRKLFSIIIRFTMRRFRIFMRINLNRSLYPLVETRERTRELLFTENLPDELIKKSHGCNRSKHLQGTDPCTR